jgi:hypothetical protein
VPYSRARHCTSSFPSPRIPRPENLGIRPEEPGVRTRPQPITAAGLLTWAELCPLGCSLLELPSWRAIAIREWRDRRSHPRWARRRPYRSQPPHPPSTCRPPQLAIITINCGSRIPSYNQMPAAHLSAAGQRGRRVERPGLLTSHRRYGARALAPRPRPTEPAPTATDPARVLACLPTTTETVAPRPRRLRRTSRGKSRNATSRRCPALSASRGRPRYAFLVVY